MAKEIKVTPSMRRDPSGLKATEDRRAKEAEKDLKLAIAAATRRVTEGRITDARGIQAIVDEELDRYKVQATAKTEAWVLDTVQRAAIRAEQLLKAGGGIINPAFGPRGITQETKDRLTVNVDNEIASLSASAKSKVTAALIDGMGAGEGPRVIAKRISEDTAMERSRAVRIARTETMRANNQGYEEQYKRYGVKRVRWLAAYDDGRRCDECAELDGTEYDIDSHPDIPAHPNCRCILTPVIPEVA